MENQEPQAISPPGPGNDHAAQLQQGYPSAPLVQGVWGPHTTWMLGQAVSHHMAEGLDLFSLVPMSGADSAERKKSPLNRASSGTGCLGS